jgi:tetratricopeptide (TPR) repeat protein
MEMYPKLVKSGLVCAACLGSLPCFGAVCAAPPILGAKLHTHADAATYTELGNWFGDHNQYDCAVDAFRSALQFEPGSAELYYLVGLSLYSSGNAQDAVTALEKSVFLLPEVLKPRLILASAFEQLQRRDEAMIEWQAALRIDHRSKEAIDGMSKALMATGDYPSAIGLLRSAPHDESLTLDLAEAYGRSGDLADAEKTLTQALRLNPSSLRLTNALTIIMVNQTRFEDALHLAEKSFRLHPNNIDAERLYLRVLVLNNDSTRARPLARKLLTAAPHDFDFLYMSGILENQAAEYDAARGHLEQAVALNPNYYNARYNLGVALAELKDLSGAKDQLEKAIALGGNEPEIRFKLASVLRALGETQQAEEQLKLYQQQLQANSRRALAASKSAQAAKEQDPQKAAALYREAFDATPQDAALAFKLALALDHTGDTAAERTILEQAIQINPTMALAQNQLGYLLSRSGDSSSAEEHFRLAVKAAPGYTQAWISLAATLGMESRFPEAQEALASALRLDPQNAEALQLRKDLTAAQAQR